MTATADRLRSALITRARRVVAPSQALADDLSDRLDMPRLAVSIDDIPPYEVTGEWSAGLFVPDDPPRIVLDTMSFAGAGSPIREAGWTTIHECAHALAHHRGTPGDVDPHGVGFREAANIIAEMMHLPWCPYDAEFAAHWPRPLSEP